MPNKRKPSSNPTGRPLKFKSVDELQKRIDAYFKSRKANKENPYGNPITLTGLALWLGTNRQTLINYEKKDVFFDTISTAKGRIEEFYEGRLVHAHATGPIFALKNNFKGWRDTQTLANDPDDPLIVEHVVFKTVHGHNSTPK